MTTAWLLPGGASMGAAQVGQAEALLAAGQHPDLLIGTSAGSLNAAWLATYPGPEGVAALRAHWLAVRRPQVFPLSPWRLALGFAGRRDHTVSSAPLERWVRDHAPVERIEQAALPLTVTATDLDRGEPVLLTEGPLVPALLASCAMPGVFPPVQLGGRRLVDGGLVADAPATHAAACGADRIFLLPAVGPGGGRVRGAGDALLRAIGIMLAAARQVEVEAVVDRCEVFVLPGPQVPGVSPFSFAHSHALIDDGRARTAAWWPTARPLRPVALAPDPDASPTGVDGRRSA